MLRKLWTRLLIWLGLKKAPTATIKGGGPVTTDPPP